jgi:hypothetical protein
MEAPLLSKLYVPAKSPLHALIVQLAPQSVYWTFEETTGGFVDKVRGLVLPRGTVVSGAGLIGDSLNFSNPSQTTAFVLNTNPPVLTLGSTSGISMWFWVKIRIDSAPSSPITGLGTGVFAVSNAAPNNFLTFSVSLATTATDISCNFGDGSGDGYMDYQLPYAPLLAGQWIFVCAVWDKAATSLILYLNGVAVATNSFAGPPVISHSFSGGSLSDGLFWPYLVGETTGFGATGLVSVDELGLCLNKALNADGVAALYNSGNGLSWPEVKPFLLS